MAALLAALCELGHIMQAEQKQFISKQWLGVDETSGTKTSALYVAHGRGLISQGDGSSSNNDHRLTL